jgi:hypothetical protein
MVREDIFDTVMSVGIGIAITLVAGTLLGYSFTKGSQMAGCIQGTCSTPALSNNIL